MGKIKTWWQAYLRKESIYGHISNAVFIIFVILMLIPSTRRVVSENLVKLTLFDRGTIDKIDDPVNLSSLDKGSQFIHDGEVYTMYDFEGEVIVINFWASWCPPCIAEMPNFNELYKDYNSEVKFMFASNDDLSKLEKFMNENEYLMPIFQYQYLPDAFVHSSIPTTFIIDRNGEVVFEHSGAYKWDSESVREFLDGLIFED